MRTKYTNSLMSKIVAVLNRYPSVISALPEINALCDWEVTERALKSALRSSGISLKQVLNSENNFSLQHTYWSLDKLLAVAAILGKKKTVGEGLAEIGEKFDRVVSGSALRNAFRSQGLAIRPSDLLKTSEARKEKLSLLKSVKKSRPKRTSYGTPASVSGSSKKVSKKKPIIEAADADYTEVLDKLVAYAGKHKKGRHKGKIGFRELCDHFNMSPKSMEELIKEGLHRGYRILLDDDHIGIDLSVKTEKSMKPLQNEVYLPEVTTGKLRVGVFSDTHCGSKHYCEDQTVDFVRRCHEDYGVRTMLHCGDILAGNNVYRGQPVELSAWGLVDQADICAETFPQYDDMVTYYILGNHDVDFIKSSGANPATEISKKRPDMKCIGTLCETLAIPLPSGEQFIIELAHIKSSAHARSYSLEKHIYRTVSRDSAPDASFSGHRHTNGYFSVQGIDAFLVPCFEAPNFFAAYGDYYPSIGGLIVTFSFDKTGNTSLLDMTWVRYNDRIRTKPTILSSSLVK